jgi:hypothetical protein
VSFSERVLSGLRTIVLIEERTKLLDDTLKTLKARLDSSLVDHERRLVRLETIVEIARPDGAILRIAEASGDHSQR